MHRIKSAERDLDLHSIILQIITRVTSRKKGGETQ